MPKEVKYLSFLFVIVVCFQANTIYAKKNSTCELSDQETYREGLIEVGDLACDDFLDCVLILNFPKQYQNTAFKKISLMPDKDEHGLMPALVTSEVKDHLSSHVYGSQDFLTSLKFLIVFEPAKGCSFWSTLVLE